MSLLVGPFVRMVVSVACALTACANEICSKPMQAATRRKRRIMAVYFAVAGNGTTPTSVRPAAGGIAFVELAVSPLVAV